MMKWTTKPGQPSTSITSSGAAGTGQNGLDDGRSKRTSLGKNTYIHTYMHACTHTYIHTYIHTHIHTWLKTRVLKGVP